MVTLEQILEAIQNYTFEHSQSEIEIINDVWMNYDFQIDEIKEIQGGSVNCGFGNEYELLKEVTFDVVFYIFEDEDIIKIPEQWKTEIENKLIEKYS